MVHSTHSFNSLFFLCLSLCLLLSCKARAPLTMTCQFNFFEKKGGCSFINESGVSGKGCVKVEVFHVTNNEVVDSTVLCAPEVPAMESITKPLTFEKGTLKKCKPELVKKKGKKRERIQCPHAAKYPLVLGPSRETGPSWETGAPCETGAPRGLGPVAWLGRHFCIGAWGFLLFSLKTMD